MTSDEALHIRDMARAIRERMAADGVIASPVKDEAIDILAAEVRRYQAMRCDGCRHDHNCEIQASAQSGGGFGCLAWEKRDA